MFKSFIIFLLSLILLSSCSLFGAKKETKALVADGLSPSVLYDQAKEKISAGSIDQGIEQFQSILASYPGSKYAIQARLDIAYNLFKRQKYNRAIQELDLFIERYPETASTAYAYYLRGIVAEKRSASVLDKIVTDNAQRDVRSTREAYDYFILLIEKFPNSKYSKEALKKLNILRNTLARHEFYIAIYYTNIGSNIAAINRSKYIIENYPNSSSIPDSIHLMAFNYDEINAPKLAEDARKILLSSYPDHIAIYSID